jgi:DNA-directed RNA polymerase specialized sigma24 family protein
MDIVQPEIERTINWWAWNVSKSFPSLEREDIVQELWVHATVAAKTWDQSKNAALSAYLYPKIRWGALQLMRNQARHLDNEKKCVQLDQQVVPPQTRTMSSVVDSVKSKLQTKSSWPNHAAKVFEVFVDPPKELLELADERIDLVDDTPNMSFKKKHVAMYLNLSVSCVNALLVKIRKVIETEIQSEQKRRTTSS